VKNGRAGRFAVRDELTEGIEPAEKSGLSRRNALKAGVAVGVGAAAWSGVSITSLGGTPAYAAGCTTARTFTLNDCDSTDSASGTQFRYQGMQATGDPNFFVNNPPPNTGTPCETFAALNVEFVFPAGFECRLVVRFFNSGIDICNKFPTKGPATHTHTLPLDNGSFDSVSPLEIDLTCYDADISGNNWFYSIEVQCKSLGSPASCFPF
jgi:hypothetical protein